MSFADSHNAGNDAVAHIQAKIAILLALHSPKLSAVQNQGKLLAPLYFQLHLLLMCVIGRVWVDSIAEPLQSLNRNVVIVSPDCEGAGDFHVGDGSSEFGIAWLRFADVATVPLVFHGRGWHPYIHAYHFINTLTLDHRLCQHIMGDKFGFIWGESTHYDFKTELLQYVQDLFTPDDTK